MPAIPLTEQIRCVEREISQREQVYPRLVRNGRMKPLAMEREIASMKAVLSTLRELHGDPTTPSLFDPPAARRIIDLDKL